jgi:hypothetical protein
MMNARISIDEEIAREEFRPLVIGWNMHEFPDAIEPSDEDVGAAEFIVSADMLAFFEWFADEVHPEHVESERITRHPALTERRLQEATAAQVMHLVLTGDDGDALLARKELRARYLKAQESRIAELAQRFAEGRE